MSEANGEIPEIKCVGIIGAGQMGNGIAHVCALAGYDVVMTDISQESLDAAMALIGRNLDRQVSREKVSQADRDAALDRITHPRQFMAWLRERTLSLKSDPDRG